MGCTSGTEKYVDGHHGPSLNVLCVPWGHTGQVGQRSMLMDTMGPPSMYYVFLGDIRDRWDREVC